MKTALLTLALLVGFSVSTIASIDSRKNHVDRAAGLKSSITNVLEVPDFLKEKNAATYVEMTFTINQFQELKVENVYTEDERLKSYVMDKLNGMIVSGDLLQNTVYSITLHFEVL